MHLPGTRWPMLGLVAQSGLARLSDQMAAIVYGWGLLRETESSATGGLVMAASFAALGFGTLFAGRLIGRFGARSIALASTWLSVTAAAAIAILLTMGLAHPALIALLAALGAVLDGPSAIASETHYPQIARLARFDLIKLNAIDDGLDGAATLVAPAVGVALVTVLGLAGGAWALALLGLLAALMLTVSFPRFPIIRGASSVTLRSVGQAILGDRLLSGLTLLFSIAVGVFVAVELVVLPRILHGTAQDAQLLTLFLLTGGVAALLGAALSKALAARLSLRAFLAGTFLSLAGGIALLTTSTAMPIITASAVLCGLPSGLIGPLAASIYQMRPPRALRANVQALSGALIFAAAPVAVFAAGLAVDALPIGLVLAVFAALMATGALLAAIALPAGDAIAATQPLDARDGRSARPAPQSTSSKPPPGRLQAIDALRGAALFGIIIVNAPYFAGPLNNLPVSGWLDAFAVWLTGAFFAGKFFLIFSFLFGFGFATLLGRAEREGSDIGPKFMRRLFGLFIFGALHACLLFFGDILMLYAALGLVLWLCRRWSRRRLLVGACLAYLLGAVLQTAALLAALEEAAGGVSPTLTPGAGYLGGFLDVAAARLFELPASLGFIVAFNGLPALAMFLAGLALGRDGAFPPTAEALKRNGWRYGASLAIGAGVSGVATLATMGASPVAAGIGFAILSVAAPALSFGMAGTALAWLSRHSEAPVVLWLARAGGSSLSGYILHSIILGAIFYGWGLGYYGSLGPPSVLAIGASTFLAVVVVLNIWRRFFRYGPGEWLHRSFVDLQWKPMRN